MCHHCAQQLAISHRPPPPRALPPQGHPSETISGSCSPKTLPVLRGTPYPSLHSKKGTNFKRKLLILSTCWRRPAAVWKRCQRGRVLSPTLLWKSSWGRELPCPSSEKGPGPLQALSKHHPSKQSHRTFQGVLISFPIILYRTLHYLKTKAPVSLF